MNTLEVLYEDNHVIAIWKPAGVLVESDHTGDESLFEKIRRYIKEKYQKPGNVFLGLIHRLDRPVSGIVLFAKTSKGASRLSEQFRNHSVEKIYHARLQGVLEKSGRLFNYMAKKQGEENAHSYQPARAIVSDAPFSSSVEAELSFKILEKSQNDTVVEIQLETGRYHQIRAQFAHIGHPIVGDRKYGAKINEGHVSDNQKTIALSAVRLSFETATTGEWITLTHSPHF